MTWTNSHTGRKLTILDLQPEMICIEDVAHGLAGTMRYRAQTFLSVAQHSVAVLACCERLVKLVPHDARFILLHDASEAYTCDIPAPVKNQDQFKGLVAAEVVAQAAVYRAFDVFPEQVSDPVLEALILVDRIVRVTEKRFFHKIHPEWKDPEPVPKTLMGVMNTVYLAEWPPEKAKKVFLKTWEKVRG